MTEEQAIEFYEELKEYWGDKLANFEHYPKTFQWQVNVYKVVLDRKKEKPKEAKIYK